MRNKAARPQKRKRAEDCTNGEQSHGGPQNVLRRRRSRGTLRQCASRSPLSKLFPSAGNANIHAHWRLCQERSHFRPSARGRSGTIYPGQHSHSRAPCQRKQLNGFRASQPYQRRFSSAYRERTVAEVLSGNGLLSVRVPLRRDCAMPTRKGKTC